MRPSNSRPQVMKQVAVFVLRVTLFAAAEVLFFILAPWPTCRPLNTLANEALSHGGVPDYAQCYYINHGQIVFRANPPLADDPWRFAMYAALFLFLIGLFLWSGRWWRRNIHRQPSLRTTVWFSNLGRGVQLSIAALVIAAVFVLLVTALSFEGTFGIAIMAPIAIGATAFTSVPLRKSQRLWDGE